MFKRRSSPPILNRVREFVWPRQGWRRSSIYLAHRVGRLPGTPYGIAAGFACGASISFTPFMGFHFIGAALLALVFRGNLIASALGTVIGNPWTFPLIWALTYSLGRWMLGGEAISDLPQNLSLQYIFDRPLKVLWPMSVGGVATAITAWFAFFWPIRGAVAQYQLVRRRRLQKKAGATGRRAWADAKGKVKET